MFNLLSNYNSQVQNAITQAKFEEFFLQTLPVLCIIVATVMIGFVLHFVYQIYKFIEFDKENKKSEEKNKKD